MPEQVYVTVTYVGLLLTEAKEMLCRFIEEQLLGGGDVAHVLFIADALLKEVGSDQST